MEWEQVSETGPPHDKTFTWSLKMGEMLTMGSGNSKKGAKNKAAEEMVKKLDQLPKLAPKRQYNQAFQGQGGPMGRGGWRGRGAPSGFQGRGGYMGQMGPPGQFGYGQPGYGPQPGQYGTGGNVGVQIPPPEKKPKPTPPPQPKKKEKPAENHPAQNNPISKLYEHTKKEKMPEPVFEVVKEEVLETSFIK